MSCNNIPVEEALYVFGKWTLMIASKAMGNLVPPQEVDILDEFGHFIGSAKIEQILPSNNPDIIPVAVSSIVEPKDFKLTRSVSWPAS